jgi:hypothetical protein
LNLKLIEMSWWKYKGEANNLFGLPPQVKQEQSNMPGKNSSSSQVKINNNSNKQKKKQQVINNAKSDVDNKQQAEIKAFKRKLKLWNDVLIKPVESVTSLISTFQVCANKLYRIEKYAKKKNIFGR